MRIPIAVKYSSLILAIILATSGLLSWFFLDLTHTELKQQLHRRGEAGTRQLAYLVAPLLLGKDEAKVGAALNHVLKDPDILDATVIDAEDIVVADKQPDRAGRKFNDPDLLLPNLKGATSREDDEHDLLTFFEPSQFGGVRVGGVVLQMSQGSVRRALREASTRVLTITGIIAGAVMALSFLMLRRTLKPLTQVLEGTRRISSGDFSARLEVRSGDEIGDLAEAFNGMAARTELFFRYLDKDIAERLSQDESLARPGGHLRAVSVLFGDMRGFTALSNQRSPSEVVSILNTYFEIFFRVIHHYAGVVDKTMGDAIMAFFEPADSTDLSHARRATLAAVAMKAAVWTIKRTVHEASRQQIPLAFTPPEFGFAVATGRLIVGNIGSDRHLNYTVCGPAVNLAARLQQETSAGEVVLDKFTSMDVEDLVTCRQLDQVQPKGFSEAQLVTPFQVTALRSAEWKAMRQLHAKLLDQSFFEKHLEVFLGEDSPGRTAENIAKAPKMLVLIAQTLLDASPSFLTD